LVPAFSKSKLLTGKDLGALLSQMQAKPLSIEEAKQLPAIPQPALPKV
jgi:hypothetical protein